MDINIYDRTCMRGVLYNLLAILVIIESELPASTHDCFSYWVVNTMNSPQKIVLSTLRCRIHDMYIFMAILGFESMCIYGNLATIALAPNPIFHIGIFSCAHTLGDCIWLRWGQVVLHRVCVGAFGSNWLSLVSHIYLDPLGIRSNPPDTKSDNWHLGIS